MPHDPQTAAAKAPRVLSRPYCTMQYSDPSIHVDDYGFGPLSTPLTSSSRRSIYIDVDNPLASSVPAETPRQVRALRTGFRFFYKCSHLLWPILFLVVFFFVLVAGTLCLLDPGINDLPNILPWCKPTFGDDSIWISLILTGFFGPFVALSIVNICLRRSHREQLRENFFGDALLEELLSGQHVFEHFDCQGEGNKSKGTVVFLSGIGVPRIVSLVHSDQISLDYRTLSIDLPGSGSLVAVSYSLQRCQRVLNEVLDRVLGPSRNTQILLCAYEGAADAAMYFAEKNPNRVSGLVLYGANVSDNSQKNPCGYFCSAKTFFLGFFRMNWYCYLKNLIALGHIKHSEIPESIKDIIIPNLEFNLSMIPVWKHEVYGVDLVGNLSEYNKPLLLLTEEDNPIVNRVLESIKNPTIRALANIGDSCVPYREWEECNGYIRGFARTLQSLKAVPRIRSASLASLQKSSAEQNGIEHYNRGFNDRPIMY